MRKKLLGSLAPLSATLYSKSSGVPLPLHLIRSWQDGSRPPDSKVSTRFLATYVRVNREITLVDIFTVTVRYHYTETELLSVLLDKLVE